MSDLASRIDSLVGEAVADVEADRRLIESMEEAKYLAPYEVRFNPSLHPRDRAGKFLEKLHGMRRHQHLRINATDVEVHKVHPGFNTGYVVKAGGTSVSRDHLRGEDAVRIALEHHDRRKKGADMQESAADSEAALLLEGKPSAAQKCKYGDHPASKSLIWANGNAYIPVCDDHEARARKVIADQSDEVDRVIGIAESEADEIRDLVKSLHHPCDCGADNLPHEHDAKHGCPASPVQEGLYDEALHPRGRGGQWAAKIGRMAELHRTLGGGHEVQGHLDAGDLHAGDAGRIIKTAERAKGDAAGSGVLGPGIAERADELSQHAHDALAHMRSTDTLKIHAPASAPGKFTPGDRVQHRDDGGQGVVTGGEVNGRTPVKFHDGTRDPNHVFSIKTEDLESLERPGQRKPGSKMSRRSGHGLLAESPEDALAESLFLEERIEHAIFFDPSLHPRDRKGEFSDVLGRLAHGVEVNMPNGVTIQRGRVGGFRVRGRGGTAFAHSPEQAASHAMAFHDGMRSPGGEEHHGVVSAWSPHAAQSAAHALRAMGEPWEAAHTESSGEIRTHRLDDHQLGRLRDHLADAGHHTTASEVHDEIAGRLERDTAHRDALLTRRSNARAAVTGQRSGSKAQALVDAGLANDLADARAQLADMGERGMASPGGNDIRSARALAAHVSRTLADAGHRPLSSGAGRNREGTHVSGSSLGHVLVSVDHDSPSSAKKKADDLHEVLKGHGFAVERVSDNSMHVRKSEGMASPGGEPSITDEVLGSLARAGVQPGRIDAMRATRDSTIAARNRDGGLTVIAHTRHVDISGDQVGRSGATVWKGSRIDGIRKIVADHQAHEIDGMVVDAQTANLLAQVYDAVSDKKKFETLPLARLVDFAWGQVGSGRSRVAEAVELLLL